MAETLTLNKHLQLKTQKDVEGGESQLWEVTRKSTVSRDKVMM